MIPDAGRLFDPANYYVAYSYPARYLVYRIHCRSTTASKRRVKTMSASHPDAQKTSRFRSRFSRGGRHPRIFRGVGRFARLEDPREGPQSYLTRACWTGSARGLSCTDDRLLCCSLPQRSPRLRPPPMPRRLTAAARFPRLPKYVPLRSPSARTARERGREGGGGVAWSDGIVLNDPTTGPFLPPPPLTGTGAGSGSGFRFGRRRCGERGNIQGKALIAESVRDPYRAVAECTGGERIKCERVLT